jgi:hypothetical protein
MDLRAERGCFIRRGSVPSSMRMLAADECISLRNGDILNFGDSTTFYVLSLFPKQKLIHPSSSASKGSEDDMQGLTDTCSFSSAFS